MKIPFTKMQASGNDFIVIDEFETLLIPDEKKPGAVRRMADRHFSIGSDGVIFIQKSKIADVKFAFYNPDGSIAEMCGNGIRCFARYMYERGLVKKEKIMAETLAGLIAPEVIIENGAVTNVMVDMGAPRIKRKDIVVSGDPESVLIGETINVDGEEYEITAAGMGNPHAIIFSDNLDSMDVKGIGSKIRNARDIFPPGTNVHFVEKVGRNEFKIRSYERGVEDETLACGTGICASAAAAFLNDLVDDKKILFHSKGGDLRVELETDDKEITRVYLTGPAEEVFNGEIKAEL